MMMPYVMYYTSMLCKGCYPNSMVLSYSCGQAKYIRICYVWRVYFFESGGKNSPFSRISGYILAETKVTIALHLIKSENVRHAMKQEKKRMLRNLVFKFCSSLFSFFQQFLKILEMTSSFVLYKCQLVKANTSCWY